MRLGFRIGPRLRACAIGAGVVGIVAAATASCTARDVGVNPKQPLWVLRPGWVLDIAFRRTLTSFALVTAKSGIERSVPEIDARHERVFVGSSDEGLYALRASDGGEIWRFQTGGGVMSEPLYDETRDRVYFGSDDDGLYAVHASDGSLIYRYRTGAEVQRKPVLVERPNGKATLVFDNAADGVFAVDADTGAPMWKHQRTPELGLEIAGHAGVAYANGRVYAAFSTGKVTAYDIDDGSERWPDVDLTAPTTAGEDTQKFFDVDTTPVVHGDHVFVASAVTGVYALDATSGTRQWRRPEASGVSWLTYWTEAEHVDPDTGAEIPERQILIAGSGTTGLWALDPATGDVRWRKTAPRGSIYSPVAIAGALLVTTSKLGVFLVQPNNGTVIDGIDPDTGFSSPGAAFGNRAYVLSNGGVLIGLEVTPPAHHGGPVRQYDQRW